MAQRKILFISSDGVPVENNILTDEITFKGYTAQDYFEVADPTTGWLNQTVSDLVFDNIMGKDRSNTMALASDILFGAVTDVSAQVDSLKIPHMTAVPTATPSANTNPGYIVSQGGSLWMWDGVAWNDLGVSDAAAIVENIYTAGEALAASNAVYISATDTVSKAIADNTSKSYSIGFAKAAALITAAVQVVSDGLLAGFSGLSAGVRYYLSDITTGAVTPTVPTSSGKTIVQMGYAKSATEMQIQILQLGRRA